MATVRFLVKGKENPASIYLRFRHGRNLDFTKNTGYVIDPKSWNKTKRMPYQRCAHLKNLWSDLNQLSTRIIIAFNRTSMDDISKEWLRLLINEQRGIVESIDKNHDLLTVQIQNVINEAGRRENALGGYGISKSRIGSYKRLKELIIEFQKNSKIQVADVDILFGKKFLEWMIEVKQYSQSYSRKKLDDIKTVCRNAKIYGIQTSHQLDSIKAGKFKTQQILYLTPHELEKIEKITHVSPALDNARKWLLFGCMIGQRGGDLLSIREGNFVVKNKLKMIELVQQKTGKHVVIPVLDEVENLIQDGLPYPISLQKFNDHIKDVCCLAGIDEIIEGYRYDKRVKRKVKGKYLKYELMTSHVCRRSFATNMYIEWPVGLLMQITGHSTEQMFLNYIGKGSLDYAKQIAEFYEKLKRRKSHDIKLMPVKEIANF